MYATRVAFTEVLGVINKKMHPKEIIQKMLDIINPIMNQDKSRQLDFPVEFTFFHALERIQYNLHALDLFMKTDILKYEHGIGLNCRNLLSDFITLGYIVKLSKDLDEYYVNFYRLYKSDFKKTENFLTLFTKAEIVTKEYQKKYDERKNDPNDIYKIVFDYADQFELKPFPSNAGIVGQFIDSKKNDLWTKEIINSYDIWIFYSKYEHIGWHSYGMTRDTSMDKAIERLKSVLNKTTILLSSCLETLNEEKQFRLATELMKQVYNA
jgi:hypothetical protein